MVNLVLTASLPITTRTCRDLTIALLPIRRRLLSLKPFGRMQVANVFLQPQPALQSISAVRARIRSCADVLTNVTLDAVDRSKFARTVRAFKHTAAHSMAQIDMPAPVLGQFVDGMKPGVAHATPIMQPLTVARLVLP